VEHAFPDLAIYLYSCLLGILCKTNGIVTQKIKLALASGAHEKIDWRSK